MPKPAELKKRARRLAQDGKIVDAVRVLEELVDGGNVDPYDLVTLGDLCMRGGRIPDASDYYARAVKAYRDASLLRNGIALCRKVVRSPIDDNRFLLLMGELCELEGLTVDAATSLLQYGEALDPAKGSEDDRWLDSLARLSPRDAGLLIRQAELLTRWNRAARAVALLRQAAAAATDDGSRETLEQMASQIVALDTELVRDATQASDVDRSADPRADQADDLSDWMGPAAGTRGGDEASIEPISDLDFGDLDLGAMPSGKDEPRTASPDPAADEDGDGFIELSEATDADVAVWRPDEETDFAVEQTAITSAHADRDDDAAREPGPEPELESAIDAVTSPAGGHATSQAPADDGPSGEASAVSDEEVASLQARLRHDPFNPGILEKLLEVYESEGDILSALDLRERLAQALLQAGDSRGALDHYRRILRVEPNHRTVRERFRQLAAELGEAADASPDEGDGAGPTQGSSLAPNGMARVEVRDESGAVSEEDMLDLGSLLAEFREGLKEGMGEAPARAHYDMGLSHMEMGLYAEAAEAFESACADPELEPESRELWGRCLRELGRHTDAVKVLRAALALRPESLGVRYQLALALEADGEPEEAIRLHRSVLREDPDFQDSRARMEALGGSDCPTPPPSQ